MFIHSVSMVLLYLCTLLLPHISSYYIRMCLHASPSIIRIGEHGSNANPQAHIVLDNGTCLPCTSFCTSVPLLLLCRKTIFLYGFCICMEHNFRILNHERLYSLVTMHTPGVIWRGPDSPCFFLVQDKITPFLFDYNFMIHGQLQKSQLVPTIATCVG